MALQAFEQLWEEEDPLANDMFQQTKERLNNSATQLRETVHNMKPLEVMGINRIKDERNIRLAILAGAEGYLIKSTKIQSMAQQIRALGSGTTVLDSEVLEQLTQNPKIEYDQLTPREKDILELVAQGLSNREIGQQLFITEGTVRNGLSIILEKLRVRDRTQLAIHYWKGSTYE